MLYRNEDGYLVFFHNCLCCLVLDGSLLGGKPTLLEHIHEDSPVVISFRYRDLAIEGGGNGEDMGDNLVVQCAYPRGLDKVNE